MSKKQIQPNKSAESCKLESVRQSFEHWRQTREKFGPIPDDLWSSAVELTGVYPLSRVSQALRLNYADLKKRVASSVSSRTSARVNSSVATGEFIDIVPMGTFPSRAPISDYSLEICDGDGFSVKLNCTGKSDVDLLELCRMVMDRRG